MFSKDGWTHLWRFALLPLTVWRFDMSRQFLWINIGVWPHEANNLCFWFWIFVQKCSKLILLLGRSIPVFLLLAQKSGSKTIAKQRFTMLAERSNMVIQLVMKLLANWLFVKRCEEEWTFNVGNRENIVSPANDAYITSYHTSTASTDAVWYSLMHSVADLFKKIPKFDGSQVTHLQDEDGVIAQNVLYKESWLAGCSQKKTSNMFWTTYSNHIL